MKRQTASAVFMVRPAVFGSNPQTAASNAFQQPCAANSRLLHNDVLREFDAFVEGLSGAGVDVLVLADEPQPTRPDAIFPCNWVTLHADGRGLLYPMEAPNRRFERRPEALAELLVASGYQAPEFTDLSQAENSGRYCEGSGSLTPDYLNGVMYANRSSRTDEALAREVAGLLGLESVFFSLSEPGGLPVYHTDVLLSIGEGFAVFCNELSGEGGELVETRLRDSGRDLLTISVVQMQQFAANLLQMQNTEGSPVIALSQRAWESLDTAQQRLLERHGELVMPDLTNIENHGGGSARCMLAEVFLPRSA